MYSVNWLRLPASASPNSCSICSAEAVLGQLVPSWWPCFSICMGLSQDGDLHVQAVKAKLLCWFKMLIFHAAAVCSNLLRAQQPCPVAFKASAMGSSLASCAYHWSQEEGTWAWNRGGRTWLWQETSCNEQAG